MKFTVVFIGQKPVARGDGWTIKEVQEKCGRLGRSFRAELYQGDKLMARVTAKEIEWVERPTGWDHLLEEDGL